MKIYNFVTHKYIDFFIKHLFIITIDIKERMFYNDYINRTKVLGERGIHMTDREIEFIELIRKMSEKEQENLKQLLISSIEKESNLVSLGNAPEKV